MVTQFWQFLRGIVVGPHVRLRPGGRALRRPVLRLLLPPARVGDRADRQYFPVTASIAIGAAILWLLLGVSTGVLAALKRGTWVDRLATASTVAGVSAPAYLLGLSASMSSGSSSTSCRSAPTCH